MEAAVQWPFALPIQEWSNAFAGLDMEATELGPWAALLASLNSQVQWFQMAKEAVSSCLLVPLGLVKMAPRVCHLQLLSCAIAFQAIPVINNSRHVKFAK